LYPGSLWVSDDATDGTMGSVLRETGGGDGEKQQTEDRKTTAQLRSLLRQIWFHD